MEFSILSCGKDEFGADQVIVADDQSQNISGQIAILSLDGYHISLPVVSASFINGNTTVRFAADSLGNVAFTLLTI